MSRTSDEEVVEYYRRVHHDAISRQIEDQLAPIIAPWDGRLANYFEHFAQSLAMNAAFRQLCQQYGSLRGLDVLDIGCGRGRWTRAYVSRGAAVTGVDVSEKAIMVLSAESPGQRFLCQDVRSLHIPSAKFDIASSVTVLQHLTEEGQVRALERLAQHIKPGGVLLLLENTFDFGSAHVTPHTEREWINMANELGFSLIRSRQVCFCIGIRLARMCLLARSSRTPNTDRVDNMLEVAPSFQNWTRRIIKEVVALPSFPLELFFTVFPIIRGTHSLMLFALERG